MRAFCTAAAALALCAAACAAELGPLQVVSPPGAPFSAVLSVHRASGEGPVVVALSPALFYRGPDLESAAGQINFSLSAAETPGSVRITSEAPAGQDAFPLLVELRTSAGLERRLYRVDVRAGARPVPPEPLPASSPKSVPRSSTVPTATPKAPVPAAALPKALPPAASPAPVPSAASRPAAPAPAPVKKTVSPETVRLTRGQTLWALGGKLRSRYPGASAEQILAALVRRTPGCFRGGSPSGVQAGCALALPSPEEVLSVPEDEARRLVHGGR